MRPKHKLTAKQVRTRRNRRYRADGDCLACSSRDGHKSWAFVGAIGSLEIFATWDWKRRTSGRRRPTYRPAKTSTPKLADLQGP